MNINSKVLRPGWSRESFGRKRIYSEREPEDLPEWELGKVQPGVGEPLREDCSGTTQTNAGDFKRGGLRHLGAHGARGNNRDCRAVHDTNYVQSDNDSLCDPRQVIKRLSDVALLK